MLKWLLEERNKVAARLKAVQIEACRLEGGLAALEAAIAEMRKHMQAGGGSVAAPAPTPTPSAPAGEPMKAVKLGRGSVQADEEFRD